MMLPVQTVRDAFSRKTLEECYRIRREIMRDLIDFEDHGTGEESRNTDLFPETVHAMNNLYLAEICRLIEEKESAAAARVSSGYKARHARLSGM